MSGSGFDTWILELRGAGLSSLNVDTGTGKGIWECFLWHAHVCICFFSKKKCLYIYIYILIYFLINHALLMNKTESRKDEQQIVSGLLENVINVSERMEKVLDEGWFITPLSVSIWLALLLLRKNMQVSSSWGCKIVYPREWEISSRGLKFSLVTIGILITILKKIFLLRWGDISCFVILLYSWNFSLLRSCSHHVWPHGLRWSMWGLKPSQKMGNC